MLKLMERQAAFVKVFMCGVVLAGYVWCMPFFPGGSYERVLNQTGGRSL